jgi:hypothetical protein
MGFWGWDKLRQQKPDMSNVPSTCPCIHQLSLGAARWYKYDCSCRLYIYNKPRVGLGLISNLISRSLLSLLPLLPLTIAISPLRSPYLPLWTSLLLP